MSLDQFIDGNQAKARPYNSLPQKISSSPQPEDNSSPAVGDAVTGLGTPFDNYSSDQKGDNFYDDYRCDAWYETDKGMRVIRNSGDPSIPSQNSPVRVCQPITRKIVVGSVQRWNAQPQLPSSDSQNDNEILVKVWIGFADPLQMTNGCFWRASWKYEYELIVPLDETSTYFVAASPLSVRTATQNSYTANFSKPLSDASSASVPAPIPMQVDTPLNLGIPIAGTIKVPPN